MPVRRGLAKPRAGVPAVQVKVGTAILAFADNHVHPHRQIREGSVEGLEEVLPILLPGMRGANASRAIPNNVLRPPTGLILAQCIVLVQRRAPHTLRGPCVTRVDRRAQGRWSAIHGIGRQVPVCGHGRGREELVAGLLEHVHHIDDAPIGLDAVPIHLVKVQVPHPDPRLAGGWGNARERRLPTGDAIGRRSALLVGSGPDEVSKLAIWERDVVVHVLAIKPAPKALHWAREPVADETEVVHHVLRPVGRHFGGPRVPIVPCCVEIDVGVHGQHHALG
mmetsp:Transcript_23630/g.70988  ORF Transcript_23630/g.70988 Transcript_23630/m.70988 type:complete len:279 (-) Transcript_23630:8-844(-)